jgi:hypothetical protein
MKDEGGRMKIHHKDTKSTKEEKKGIMSHEFLSSFFFVASVPLW